MNLPPSAWTWTELRTARERLSDASEVLRDMECWHLGAGVKRQMAHLDTLLRLRSLELAESAERQLPLVSPGAYEGSEVLSDHALGTANDSDGAAA